MATISNAIPTNHFVFCPPPLGKPNPNQSIDLEKPRTRVAQKAMPERTCLYSAMKVIREQIGKHPLESQQEMRRIELLISKKRKTEAEYDKKNAWEVSFAQQLSSLAKATITRQKAQNTLYHADQLMDPEHKVQGCALLKEFLAQNKAEDLLTYVTRKYFESRVLSDEAFLKEFNVSPQERYEKDVYKKIGKTWNEINESWQYKRWWLGNCAFRVSYEKYGLKTSSWTPDQPIENLQAEIDHRGAMLVVGKFGPGYYKTPPVKDVIKTKEIKDKIDKVIARSIWGWEPGSERKELEINHAIVLVGASEPGLIFYINPSEGSDPQNIETQRIYVMSEKTLKTHISDLDNLQRRHKNEPNYALYGDRRYL